MTTPDASSVAALLREFGQRSALRGGNPFRAKAYARAADSLLALSIPLEIVIAQDRLQEIPGVGEAIADIIKNAPRDQSFEASVDAGDDKVEGGCSTGLLGRREKFANLREDCRKFWRARLIAARSSKLFA